MNLITTIIGFGMSATFIIFVCTRLICNRIRQTEPLSTLFEPEFQSESEHAHSGLEPVVIAAFPTIKYNSVALSSREDAHRCSICLGEYQEKETLRIMPACGHNFHVHCIDEWLHQQSTCPVCRLPLHNSFETKPVESPMFTRSLIQAMGTSTTLRDPSHQQPSAAESNQVHYGSSTPRYSESENHAPQAEMREPR